MSTQSLVSCAICQLVFSTKTQLNLHLREAHYFSLLVLGDKRKFNECLECRRAFKDTDAVVAHLKFHSLSKYECHKCPLKYCHAGSLKTHLKRKHNLEKTKFLSECKVCRKCFVTSSLLAFHMRFHSDPSVKCGFCTHKCYTNRQLAKHIQIAHVVMPLPTAKSTTEPIYNCSVCYRSFGGNVRYLQDHLMTHYAKGMKCGTCGKVFCNQATFKRHLRLDHSIHESLTVFTCNVCNKGFRDSYKLRLHKLHHSPPTYACPICSQKFYTAASLGNHSKYCGKIFSSHAKSDGRYGCSMCLKRYPYKNELRSHILVHKFPTIPCTKCDHYCAKSVSMLQQHMRQVHV